MNTVWLLMFDIDYEGSSIIAIFDEKPAAENIKSLKLNLTDKRIVKLLEEHYVKVGTSQYYSLNEHNLIKTKDH